MASTDEATEALWAEPYRAATSGSEQERAAAEITCYVVQNVR